MGAPKTSRPTTPSASPNDHSLAGTDFNLRALVREVMNTSTLKTPDEIAAEVAKRIPKAKTAEALHQSLRTFARQVISEERPHGFRGVTSPVSSTRSAKVAGIRDGWQKKLRARYHIGDGAYEFLGDCTAENLIFIATDLDEQAARKQARARGFRRLAEALDEHGAERVRDLPAELLMNSLGDAA